MAGNRGIYEQAMRAAYDHSWNRDWKAAFEAYKARRGDYQGPYAEYKENDPYHMGVFNHQSMKVEVWKDLERDLWIE